MTFSSKAFDRMERKQVVQFWKFFYKLPTSFFPRNSTPVYSITLQCASNFDINIRWTSPTAACQAVSPRSFGQLTSQFGLPSQTEYSTSIVSSQHSWQSLILRSHGLELTAWLVACRITGRRVWTVWWTWRRISLPDMSAIRPRGVTVSRNRAIAYKLTVTLFIYLNTYPVNMCIHEYRVPSCVYGR